MRTYRQLWLVYASTTGLVGCMLCLALVPAGAWIIGAAVVAGAAVLARQELTSWASTRQVPLPGTARTASVATAAVLALWGWGSTMPVLAAVFAITAGGGALPVLLGSPTVSGLRRGQGRSRRNGSQATPTGPVPTPATDDPRPGGQTASVRDATTALTAGRLAAEIGSARDDELCRRWRTSYVRLGRTAADLRATIVLERQLVLDELLRRHPSATARWLHSGARAAGNPAPHLAREE